jgi:hypothetical protein
MPRKRRRYIAWYRHPVTGLIIRARDYGKRCFVIEVDE